MSRWRDVWRQSVKAFCIFCADRTAGEKEFERLLATCDNDPMIVYERAEAYQHVGERERARTDYLDAAARFVAPQWSEVARLGAEELNGRPLAGTGSLPDRQLRERIHSLHAFPRLPPNVLADLISGVARIDSEPTLVAMNLRATLELLAWSVLYRSNAHPGDDDDLFVLINQLDARRLIDDSTRTRMHRMRKIGNRAAHGFTITKAGAEELLRDLIPLADWYCREPWAKRAPRAAYPPR